MPHRVTASSEAGRRGIGVSYRPPACGERYLLVTLPLRQGRDRERLGHVARVGGGLACRIAVSEAGPRGRRGLARAVRVRGSMRARHAPAASRVDFAGPLVT